MIVAPAPALVSGAFSGAVYWRSGGLAARAAQALGCPDDRLPEWNIRQTRLYDPQTLAAELQPLLVPGEQVHLAFKGIRDSVVFTNKRLISINV